MTDADASAAAALAKLPTLADVRLTDFKVRILDALGCAIGALEGEPVRRIREQIEEFGGNPLVTLIGGGKTAPDRAALYNGALVRYLDYNDSYLAPGETCHPLDNLGAVLAAAEYAAASGRELLTALAVAYQVQCRLSEVAPVRHKGFDHTTQGAYAAAAGVAKALGLDQERVANAAAISGTGNNALRVTRTGALSHWKGLAYPNTTFSATHSTFLAMRGITGPPEVFEGNKGFMEAIAGPFESAWENEGPEAVRRTIVKKYNAEIHSQSALEGILELREEHHVRPEEVEHVELGTFDVAFNIIGGGEEGSKHVVRAKEEADHSLPYMLAVALVDGAISLESYTPERARIAVWTVTVLSAADHPDAVKDGKLKKGDLVLLASVGAGTPRSPSRARRKRTGIPGSVGGRLGDLAQVAVEPDPQVLEAGDHRPRRPSPGGTPTGRVGHLWHHPRSSGRDRLSAGRKPGRTSESAITLFDSTGTALEDVAAAAANLLRPWQTTLVMTAGTRGADGAFLLWDGVESHAFRTPFYELLDQRAIRPNAPKPTQMVWPSYATGDLVARLTNDRAASAFEHAVWTPT